MNSPMSTNKYIHVVVMIILIICVFLSCSSKGKESSKNTKSNDSLVVYHEQGYTNDFDGTGGILVMKSLEDIMKLAEDGDMKAQYSLGICYRDGQYVSQSINKAIEWFKKSAEQGFAMAQQELGFCYYEGNGVEQSYDNAVKWYRLSAEQGYSIG